MMGEIPITHGIIGKRQVVLMVGSNPAEQNILRLRPLHSA